MMDCLPSIRRCAPLCAAVAASLLVSATAQAMTWNVSTVSELTQAVNGAVAGDEIVVAPGTYRITTELWLRRNGVTLRGATGNRNDVLIRGGGLNSSSYARIPLHIDADDITIQDLTSGECYWHAIQLSPGADRAIIRNVRTLNAGEQHIKGSQYTRNGLIENCLMENTVQRINDGVARPDDYLGGIDLHGAIDWVIRDNIARNIIGEGTDGDAGIFLWNNSSNCLTERNLIIGCNKGIAYGNPSSKGVYHMTGGIIRNNFVVVLTGGDLGIEVDYVRNVQVCNNTIFATYNQFRALQIFDDLSAEPNLPLTNVQIAYNLIRGQIRDFTDGTGWTGIGNITNNSLPTNWFVDPMAGDLHLTQLATGAIDKAAALAEVPEDFDRNVRPYGAAPDIGADEFKRGDVDRDGEVSVLDVVAVVTRFGTTPVSEGWDPAADIDADRQITVLDVTTVVNEFGN